MDTMFDDQLLGEYMRGYYGCGHYTAPYWFIGMEDGGGRTFEYIARRLAQWRDTGRGELGEFAADDVDTTNRWFGPQAKLQPTWSRLIRILLSADGQAPTTEHVREYQRTRLGRRVGQDCLLELLPLPSPSTSQWLYGQHSLLPDLASRAAYEKTWAPQRADHIQQRITEYHPAAVVFYSLGYERQWKQIAAVPDWITPLPGVQIDNNGQTVFAITPHPTAKVKGMTSAYFHEIGKLIAESVHKRSTP